MNDLKILCNHNTNKTFKKRNKKHICQTNHQEYQLNYQIHFKIHFLPSNYNYNFLHKIEREKNIKSIFYTQFKNLNEIKLEKIKLFISIK